MGSESDVVGGRLREADPGEIVAVACDDSGASRDGSLTARESELTSDVPLLLESMNCASSQVNALERQMTAAQIRYRALLEAWTTQYDEMRERYGNTLHRVRPYFDALQLLHGHEGHMQSLARSFSAAASQYVAAKAELRDAEERLAYGAHMVALNQDQQNALSRATVRVLQNQEVQNHCEQNYTCALRSYQEALEAVEQRRSQARTQVGDAAIRRTAPGFKRLQQCHAQLASEQSRISTLAQSLKASKSTYHRSMCELDRINISVHNARRLSRDHTRRTSEPEDTAATLDDAVLCCRPAPEVSPEEEEEDEVDEQEENNLECKTEGRSVSDAVAQMDVMNLTKEAVADPARVALRHGHERG